MAERASANISSRARPGHTEGFKDFEEVFFRAGEALGSRSLPAVAAPSPWRQAIARGVSLAIFTAALVMAWKALGPAAAHEASIRLRLESPATSAQIVGDRQAWAAPAASERVATPKQRPHSATAARNRRR